MSYLEALQIGTISILIVTFIGMFLIFWMDRNSKL